MLNQKKKSIKYKVSKRKIKYLRIEIKEGQVYIILPEHLKIDCEALLDKYNHWINKKVEFFKEIKNISVNLNNFFNHQDFKNFIFETTQKYSYILNQKPRSISFRYMKRRWGSCYGSGKIIFNKFLKFLPKELIEYVVIHEVCHLKIQNHGKEFWLLVKKLCPNFAERERLLCAYKMKLNAQFIKTQREN